MSVTEVTIIIFISSETQQLEPLGHVLLAYIFSSVK